MKILIILLAAVVFLMLPSHAFAKKVLPHAKSGASVGKSTSGTITVSPRLRRDRLGLQVYFGNVRNANAISYTLVYETNGQQEGAGGSVAPNEGNSASRELLFGTCSKNDCRYHGNIRNMRLEVTADLKSGKKLIKRYKIKI